MAGDAAQGSVEALRTRPALVGRKLNGDAAARLAPRHRPVQHRPPDPGPTQARGDPHSFDLSSDGAAPSKTGDQRDLQAGHDRIAVRSDDETLVGITLDSGKRKLIGFVERLCRLLIVFAERIVRQQRENSGQIGTARLPYAEHGTHGRRLSVCLA